MLLHWTFLCRMDKYSELGLDKYFPLLILFWKALGNLLSSSLGDHETICEYEASCCIDFWNLYALPLYICNSWHVVGACKRFLNEHSVV